MNSSRVAALVSTISILVLRPCWSPSRIRKQAGPNLGEAADLLMKASNLLCRQASSISILVLCHGFLNPALIAKGGDAVVSVAVTGHW